MPDILIRDVEHDVIENVKKHARERGRSMQSLMKEAIEREFRPTLSDEQRLLRIREHRKKFEGRELVDPIEIRRREREDRQA